MASPFTGSGWPYGSSRRQGSGWPQPTSGGDDSAPPLDPVEMLMDGVSMLMDAIPMMSS